MLTSKPRLPVKDIILFGLLPSPLKILVYRLKGYKIGKGVSIGLGSVISAGDVEIGDDVQIGFLSIITSRSVKIGAHAQIGTMSYLDVPFIEIGEGSRINEQVFVGGLQFPDSKFVMGRNCQIMQMSFINPARSITMGDDSGIGGHCLLFGHSSWLSKFEGYPVEFDTIEIGRSVSVAWRVFVLPGSKIGDGTVIGANSLVRGVIPDHCLAVGFPARVVSRPPDFPRAVSDEDGRRYLHEIMVEMMEYFRGFGLRCQGRDASWTVGYHVKRWLGTRTGSATVRTFTSNAAELDDELKRLPAEVVVSLHAIPPGARDRLNAAGRVWMDIATKERSRHGSEVGDEVAMYFRRYGVRFLRQSPT